MTAAAPRFVPGAALALLRLEEMASRKGFEPLTYGLGKPLLYPAELPGRAVAALRVVLPRHVLLRGLLRSVSTTAHYSPNPARRARGCARLAAALLLSGALGEARAVEAGCGLGLERAGTAVAVRDWFEILLDDGRLVRPSSLAPFRARRTGTRPSPLWRAAISKSISSAATSSCRRGAPRLTAGAASSRPCMSPARRAPPLWPSRWAFWTRASRAMRRRLAIRVAPRSLRPRRAPRSAKLGLWAEPYYFVIAAGDVSALESRAGEFVVVEGQVRRIGQTSARFYLDFGRVRGVDFTLTISKQNSKVFDRMGTTVQSLAGKRLRVRGLPRRRIRSPDRREKSRCH